MIRLKHRREVIATNEPMTWLDWVVGFLVMCVYFLFLPYAIFMLFVTLIKLLTMPWPK